MSDLALSADVSRSLHRQATASRKHKLSVEALVGSESYAAIADDWRQLVELQDRTVLFQLPGLLAPWARHFGKGSTKSVTIVVRNDLRPVLVWPLSIERRALVTVATGAGGPIGQYDEILIDPDYDASEVFAAALEALKANFRPDLLVLERVRADGAVRAALNEVKPICWAEGAPYSDLSCGVAGLKKDLKTRVVRQQKKRVRRLGQEGQVAFEVASDPSIARGVARRGDEPEARMAEVDRTRQPRLRAPRHSRVPGGDDVDAGATRRVAAHDRLAALRRRPHGGDRDGVPPPRHLPSLPGRLRPRIRAVRPRQRADRARARLVRQERPHALRHAGAAFTQQARVAVGRGGGPRLRVVDDLRGRLYAALLKRLGPALRDTFYALPAQLRAALAGLALRI